MFYSYFERKNDKVLTLVKIYVLFLVWKKKWQGFGI